ncbi:MAG: hypothetical protein IPN42_03180 [Methylococcaceae bacterium]|nr:hypothetical protein [Methylococcaceae bacterium]
MKIQNQLKKMAYFVLLASSLSVIYSAPASAGDEKTIAATSCTALTGSVIRDDRGRIFNASTTAAANVLCPLVRDNVVAAPLSIKAVVIDNSSLLLGDGDITCSARSMSQSGNSVINGATVGTSGTNSNGTILTLTPVTELDRGAYVVVCKIPRKGVGDPNSGIASITIDEP